MNNIIEKVWKQQGLTPIEFLPGNTFTAEAGAHTFIISGVDQSGAEVALSGSPSASFIRADGTTVAISSGATLTNGKVHVTLSEECYGVTGRFALTVFLTSNGQKVAIYACVGNVARSNTSAVSPGVTADVVDLVNRIDAATASIPATYTALLAAIATDYSSSATYSKGDFVWYSGTLYRAKQDIETAESWTAGHWTQVTLANSLNDELTSLKSTLNPILHSIVTHGLGVPFQYSMKSGRKYRFVNTSSTGAVSCYLSVDGTENTFLAFSGLTPGGTTFVTAQADYEYIRVYRGAADQTIQLYVVEGEYTDALTGAESLGSTQYNNLGDSIRGQITKVTDLIDATKNNFEELLTDYVPLESINLFDKTKVSEIGHYWNYRTGQIATADNLYAADLIAVEPETVYTITSNGVVQQGCYFDDNKNFISGYTGGNYTSYEITTPQNCKYIGMSVYSGALPTYALYKGAGRTGYLPYERLVPLRYLPKSKEIIVGANGDYTSLLQALIECDDYSVVHVKKGQYDIIEEYKAYYGETYWDDYNGYSTSQDKFDRGLWLKNGVKLTFDQNAVVSFNYTGSNSKVKGNFCPFATCGNCEIDGLNLSFSGCRYAIHDDFFEVDGTEIFKNCIFSGQSYNGDTIGAGLGRSNLIIIESCLFIGNQSTADRGGDISYHNNGYTSNSKSKIIVKDCYGENTVKFKWYGTNTEVSECIVCGCQFKSIECLPHTVTPNETVNMHMTKWNCIETGN